MYLFYMEQFGSGMFFDPDIYNLDTSTRYYPYYAIAYSPYSYNPYQQNLGPLDSSWSGPWWE